MKKYSELSRLEKTKQSARSYVNEYVKQGKVEKRPCQICGDENSEAHHEDYNKPLKVVWLCRKHHFRLHEFTKPVIQLPNNCSITAFKIAPASLDMKKNWIVYYSFRSPQGKINRQIRGMNKGKTVEERLELARKASEKELFKLQSGFNPLAEKQNLTNEMNIDALNQTRLALTPLVKVLHKMNKKGKLNRYEGIVLKRAQNTLSKYF